MDIDAAALAEDLQSLWKREGVRGEWQEKRSYPQLRRACRVSEQDSPRQMERKLHATIERLMDDQHTDRVTLLTALGRRPQADQKTLEKRLEALALERHQAGGPYVSVRTIWRQLAAARDRFVRAAVADARASAAANQVGYVVVALRLTLSIIDGRVQVGARRRIRVTQDRLHAIGGSFGLPRPLPAGGTPTIAVVSGGLRCDQVYWREGAIHYTVELLQPLAAGQVHEFELRYDLPPEQPIDPHCVISPTTPFEEFNLSVCFDPRRLPERVWKVDGVTYRGVDECPEADGILALDPSGRVHARFVDIHVGLNYGIAWDEKQSRQSDTASR